MSKSPRSVWKTARQSWFSIPELGAARKIQALAPRKDGVTNAARMSGRMTARPGMSVLETSQASGAPTTTAIVATATASLKELRIGSR